MNEFSSRSRSTVAAVHQVIADMWPDDHDAMLAIMERRAASSRDPGDHDSPLIAVEPRPSSLSDYAMTDGTIADMWPDDDEVMRAFGRTPTAEST